MGAATIAKEVIGIVSSVCIIGGVATAAFVLEDRYTNRDTHTKDVELVHDEVKQITRDLKAKIANDEYIQAQETIWRLEQTVEAQPDPESKAAIAMEIRRLESRKEQARLKVEKYERESKAE